MFMYQKIDNDDRLITATKKDIVGYSFIQEIDQIHIDRFVECNMYVGTFFDGNNSTLFVE